MPCPHCGQPATRGLFTYCRDGFLEAWWTGTALKDGKPLKGMPEFDLRAANQGEWRFSLCVIISDPDYIAKSRDFQLNKLTKGRLFRNASPPNTGMGHTYVRFESPRGASSEHISFGMMAATGVTSPDEEAGKNRLQAEVAVDYVISNADKDRVCETIGTWLVGHLTNDPQYRYQLMSSNCTRFGRECCEAAGVYFPAKKLPTKTRNGWNLTDSPGMLYESVYKSHYAYDPVRERSPGACPTGYMGFQQAKARGSAGKKKQEQSMYDLRTRILAFKEEFPEVRSEPDALKLMAALAKGTIERPLLKQMLGTGMKPQEALRAASLVDDRFNGNPYA